MLELTRPLAFSTPHKPCPSRKHRQQTTPDLIQLHALRSLKPTLIVEMSNFGGAGLGQKVQRPNPYVHAASLLPQALSSLVVHK
jgi:hypothetical protein